jgi:hypothetical protein
MTDTELSVNLDEAVWNDPTGQIWTRREIQALVLQIGLTKTSRRLGLKGTRNLREWGIRTPPEYVRDRAERDKTWLMTMVIRFEGTKKAAKYLNVSYTFFRNLLEELGIERRAPAVNEEKAREALLKFGSPLFVARLLETSDTEIKKAVPDWRDIKDPTKAGDHSVRTGHIAEKYYEGLRGEKITDSPVHNNHNNKGYDYLDLEYGRVNVKGTCKSESNVWTWEIKPETLCDYYALVQMDRDKNPLGCVVVPKTVLDEGVPLPDGFRRGSRVDGKVALSTRVLCLPNKPQTSDLASDNSETGSVKEPVVVELITVEGTNAPDLSDISGTNGAY